MFAWLPGAFTNLLFTGTADSFLDQMRADLGKALGLELEFTYHSRKNHFASWRGSAVRAD